MIQASPLLNRNLKLSSPTNSLEIRLSKKFPDKRYRLNATRIPNKGRYANKRNQIAPGMLKTRSSLFVLRRVKKDTFFAFSSLFTS